MRISELDKSIEDVVRNHSVYGVECTINALVRACIKSGNKYLSVETLEKMIEKSYRRENGDRQEIKEYKTKIILESFNNLIWVCAYDNADTINMTLNSLFGFKVKCHFEVNVDRLYKSPGE